MNTSADVSIDAILCLYIVTARYQGEWTFEGHSNSWIYE